MAEGRADLAGPPGRGSEPPFEVVRRGFRQEQVLLHLARTGERVTDLESKLERAQAQLAEAREELAAARAELAEARRERDAAAERDPYEDVSEHVLELVRGFDREVERLRRRAELDATGIVADARTEAARMRLEAQRAEEQARAQVEQLLGEAREEAASVRAQLAPLRELTLSQARAIRDRMRVSLLELDAILPEPDDEQVIVLEDASDRRVPPVPPLDTPSGA